MLNMIFKNFSVLPISVGQYLENSRIPLKDRLNAEMTDRSAFQYPLLIGSSATAPRAS